MAVAAQYRLYDLPWSAGGEADARFRRILRNALVIYVLAALLLSVLPLAERDPMPAVETPSQVVQLLLERPPPPPPPPPRVEPQPQPEPRVTPVEVPATASRQPDRPVRSEPVRNVRDSGLLALSSRLAELREADVSSQLSAEQRVSASSGEASRVERSLITTAAAQGSGGIDTSSLSRDTGGATLEGRSTTRVTAGGGGAAVQAGSTSMASGSSAARSREEIEMVFEDNKGALQALFNRALRRDSSLQGKVVLKITIEPSGMVSACEVVSSELDDPELLQKLVTRVKMFRFLDKEVPPLTTTKPLDFFPA